MIGEAREEAGAAEAPGIAADLDVVLGAQPGQIRAGERARDEDFGHG